MNLLKMLDSWDSQRKLIGLLAAGNVLLAVGVVSALGVISGAKERIVLVPPHLDAKAEIGWKDADAQYKKSWGLYVATMTANVTPKTVPFVVEALSGFMDPAVYTAARRQLLALSKDPIFLKNDIQMLFEPSDIVYEPSTQKVFVLGSRVPVGGQAGKGEKVVYEMSIAIANGRPVIKSMDFYSGSEARTQQWLLRNAERLEAEKKAAAAAASAAAE